MPCGAPTGYLTSDQSYKNFVLSIEFRSAEDANSGVFVRSPKESGGYEVQIWKQQPAGYNTGSIVGTAKTARDYTFKPDQWNHLQITAQGAHIVVVLNGETTLDIQDAQFGRKPPASIPAIPHRLPEYQAPATSLSYAKS
jgi:hypothetical protein